MAAEMARRDPKDSEWRTRNAHAVRMNESAEAALAYLMKEREAFEDDAACQYEIGRYTCLTGDLKGARKAFELNREYRAKFVEDEDFDAVWDSFGEA